MRLSLNIDHIATLRNARGEAQPDPVTAALIAEQAGVDGIVVHLREDRRHINERDVRLLRELITTKLDLEMAATEEIIKIACDIGPELATIVPEKRLELTTEGGVNVIDNITLMKNTIEELHKYDIEVSLFIEPDIRQIDAAAEIKSDYIEIHTGVFANAFSEEEQFDELEIISTAEKKKKNTITNYWIIKNPDRDGICWLWGKYATVSGSTANIQEIAIPPTPTPSLPGAVRGLTASKICFFNGVTYDLAGSISWEDVPNEDGYKIYSNAGHSRTTPRDVTTSPIPNFQLVPGGSITLFVEAFNSAGKSPARFIVIACP